MRPTSQAQSDRHVRAPSRHARSCSVVPAPRRNHRSQRDASDPRRPGAHGASHRHGVRGGAGGGPAVGRRAADAGGRHGHGDVPAGARRGHQGRGAGGHRGGLPPLRHGRHVRHGAAARRRRGRGGAPRAPPVPGGGVRHVQALVHAEPPGPRPPLPPGDPQEPADGVPGPVPDPLAGGPQARAADFPQQEGGRRAARLGGRVARHGGVPAAGARQGHRRQQLHHQAPRQGARRRRRPPAVNQVELNPAWQQRALRAYCADKGVHVAAYSPLGGQNWDGTGSNAVLESEVLAGIARARGKSVAQAALRWIYEQGVTSIVKSYNKERLKQNLDIFDWELTDDDRLKISQIPQKKIVKAEGLFSQEGEFTSVDPADLDIVEE
ncbi:hypothetical protein PVAP13_7NG186791 [Panicum virgatum]|uniref:NADP-dependent oxidoreductase domain-containing protein n=1 Tax=Panicum virgatum TaxID=38727 RepID=A0A8T0Q1M6_PANVG|nr:hypothetical protein PVAP13_7NG186791 [Panicum virgatum]